jgi:hypothetical protein
MAFITQGHAKGSVVEMVLLVLLLALLLVLLLCSF